MAWTYSGDPSGSTRDLLRFYTGDTDNLMPLLSDEEMDFLIASKGSAAQAAPHACVSIMAKLAREVDYTIGPEKVSASQRLENYQKIMPSLQSLWKNNNAAPIWNSPLVGITPAIFGIGMHDNRGHE